MPPIEKSKNQNAKLLMLSVLLVVLLAALVTACGNVNKKKSLDEYATRAMNQAQEAATSGTFGVGGILLDTDGNVICEMHNQVIKGSRINDPTAHGERQIVDWYLENKEKSGLPEPQDCILITTLDPCIMCTGALAQVKFNKVIVVALDDYAGINWKGDDDCSALAGTDCQEYVKEHFAYPEVTGSLSRKALGADVSNLNLFSDSTISSETLKGCQEAFSLTADDVRNRVSSISVELADIQNPANLEPTHPIRKYLTESFGSDYLAFSWTPGDSAEALTDYIQKKHPGFQGVAYFDAFGNLLYLAEDDKNNPTQSAFMKVTRTLAAARNTEPIEGYEINEYLHHPKYGYFVYTTCPDISAKTIMEIGAIGATLETDSGHPIFYISGKENENAVNAVIEKLPPLYNGVANIRFMQIPSGN